MGYHHFTIHKYYSRQTIVISDTMQLSTLISTTVLALSSFRVAGEAYCGALEQSNPNSPSITSVSGTVTVPSDLSQFDGSGFRAYVGVTGKSCIDDYVQVNLDINVSQKHLPRPKCARGSSLLPNLERLEHAVVLNKHQVVNGVPAYTVIFDKHDFDATRRYLDTITDMRCKFWGPSSCARCS